MKLILLATVGFLLTLALGVAVGLVVEHTFGKFERSVLNVGERTLATRK